MMVRITINGLRFLTEVAAVMPKPMATSKVRTLAKVFLTVLNKMFMNIKEKVTLPYEFYISYSITMNIDCKVY